MPTFIEAPVRGVQLTTTEFRRAICDVLNKFPPEEGGRVADLVAEFGANWDNEYGRHRLAVALNNMKRTGIVAPIDGRRGYYRTTKAASRERGGVSAFEQSENAIVNVIRKHGGVARMREIVDALLPEGRVKFQGKENRPKPRTRYYTKTEWDSLSQAERDYRRAQGKVYVGQRANLGKIMRESLRIRRATEKGGWYCLDYEELRKLPQSGRNLSVLMSTPGRRLAEEAVERGLHRRIRGEIRPAKPDDWYDVLRPVMFRNLGNVVSTLVELSGMNVDEFLAIPDISDALHHLRSYANNVYQDATAFIREARKDRFYNPMDDEIRRELYRQYVAGFSALHLALSTEFIEAIADVFALDAAMLSLGSVVARDL